MSRVHGERCLFIDEGPLQSRAARLDLRGVRLEDEGLGEVRCELMGGAGLGDGFHDDLRLLGPCGRSSRA